MWMQCDQCHRPKRVVSNNESTGFAVLECGHAVGAGIERDPALRKQLEEMHKATMDTLASIGVKGIQWK